MKFTLAHVDHGNIFAAIEDDGVEVRGIRHTNSLLMAPDVGPEPWVRTFEDLQAGDFEALLQFKPEIVVFGSGRQFRFPHPKLMAALMAARVGIEVMDSRAACRTYNVLVSEGRRALVALILD